MADIDRIKRNIDRMLVQNAPESDIDAYVASEGVTLDQLKAVPPQAAPQPAEKPSAADHLTGMVTDIPKEIYDAGASALSTIKENLNPFSETRRASLERQSQMPFLSMESTKEQLGRLAGVGSGLAAIPAVPAAPITGASRAVIGHGMAAIAPDTTYEQGKGMADTAMMGVRAASVGRNMQPTTLPPKVPSTDEIKAAAKTGFDNARSSGVSVPAQDVQTMAQNIKTSLGADGFRDYLAPKTYAVLSELENPAAGASANVSDLHGIRRVLSKAASSADPTERAAASKVMSELDTMLSAVSPELKGAIGNYATLKKAEELSGRMESAVNNAGSANSGMNTENALRQQLRAVLNSPKLRRGYTAAELEQMRKIVRGTMTADAIRAAGNLLGGGLGMHGALMAGAGLMTAGPVGALAPVAGAGMKMLGNKMASNKAAALDQMIRARSPLAQSMPPRQVPPPNPLLGSVFPYGLPQALPMLMGPVPARAKDEQPVRGWR